MNSNVYRKLKIVLCLVPIEGRMGPPKHKCRIVFIGLTMTTCFGRAWPSSGHKLGYK